MGCECPSMCLRIDRLIKLTASTADLMTKAQGSAHPQDPLHLGHWEGWAAANSIRQLIFKHFEQKMVRSTEARCSKTLTLAIELYIPPPKKIARSLQKFWNTLSRQCLSLSLQKYYGSMPVH